MTKLVLAVSVVLAIGFSTHVEAAGYRHSEIRSEAPYWTMPFWVYRPPVPEGAYYATVTYGPGNRRCVSRLVQLPSRWWRPVRQCGTLE